MLIPGDSIIHIILMITCCYRSVGKTWWQDVLATLESVALEELGMEMDDEVDDEMHRYTNEEEVTELRRPRHSGPRRRYGRGSSEGSDKDDSDYREDTEKTSSDEQDLSEEGELSEEDNDYVHVGR